MGRPSDPQGKIRGQEGSDYGGRVSALGGTVFINILCCVVCCRGGYCFAVGVGTGVLLDHDADVLGDVSLRQEHHVRDAVCNEVEGAIESVLGDAVAREAPRFKLPSAIAGVNSEVPGREGVGRVRPRS